MTQYSPQAEIHMEPASPQGEDGKMVEDVENAVKYQAEGR